MVSIFVVFVHLCLGGRRRQQNQVLLLEPRNAPREVNAVLLSIVADEAHDIEPLLEGEGDGCPVAVAVDPRHHSMLLEVGSEGIQAMLPHPVDKHERIPANSLCPEVVVRPVELLVL